MPLPLNSTKKIEHFLCMILDTTRALKPQKNERKSPDYPENFQITILKTYFEISNFILFISLPFTICST
jgi:hypothetical protein